MTHPALLLLSLALVAAVIGLSIWRGLGRLADALNADAVWLEECE